MNEVNEREINESVGTTSQNVIQNGTNVGSTMNQNIMTQQNNEKNRYGNGPTNNNNLKNIIIIILILIVAIVIGYILLGKFNSKSNQLKSETEQSDLLNETKEENSNTNESINIILNLFHLIKII